ncbi:hypothetical protein HY968_05260 [Candidatus Kaiserbacteria bacterium]|nr:hypothetical protein [Candidatus Kaiserbacteria bacterium]
MKAKNTTKTHKRIRDIDDITRLAAYSKTFDFLADEAELYSNKDLKRRYTYGRKLA